MGVIVVKLYINIWKFSDSSLFPRILMIQFCVCELWSELKNRDSSSPKVKKGNVHTNIRITLGTISGGLWRRRKWTFFFYHINIFSNLTTSLSWFFLYSFLVLRTFLALFHLKRPKRWSWQLVWIFHQEQYEERNCCSQWKQKNSYTCSIATAK